MLRSELEFCKENVSLPHKSHYDRLLIPDRPLQVLPRLAVKIGLNEALVLQQVHYWICNPLNKNIREGRVWVYNTYDDWKEQFPFWSYDTIKRTITSLESKKLLISSDRFNKSPVDRKKWYTIDYEILDSLEVGTSVQNALMHQGKMPSPSVQNALMHQGKMPSCTITETTTETTTEKNPLLPLNQSVKKTFNTEFEEFWAINPKPVDKLEAREVFNRLLNEDYGNFQKIMDGRRAQNVVLKLEATPMKYIKGPASWLRKQKFNDLVQTEDQINEENRRSVSKINSQSTRTSKFDQQHIVNDQVRELSKRKLEEISREQARIDLAIQSLDGGQGEDQVNGHNCDHF